MVRTRIVTDEFQRDGKIYERVLSIKNILTIKGLHEKLTDDGVAQYLSGPHYFSDEVPEGENDGLPGVVVGTSSGDSSLGIEPAKAYGLYVGFEYEKDWFDKVMFIMRIAGERLVSIKAKDPLFLGTKVWKI
jgi:hypothetical protein